MNPQKVAPGSAGEPSARHRYRPLAHLPCLLFFAALSILFTWPLVATLTSSVIGVPGDNLVFVWNFWWARRAEAGHLPVFWTPDLFAPIGTSLVTHTFVPLASVGAAWLFPSTAPLTLYNSTLLATVFLNFACAYAAAYLHTRDRLASAYAGVAFGGAPFLLARVMGHLNVLSAWGLPLILLASVGYSRKPSVVRALAVSIALVLVAYTDYYYFIFGACLVGSVFLLSRWRFQIVARALTPGRTRLLKTIGAAMTAVLIANAWIAATGGADVDIAGLRVQMTSTFNGRGLLWMLGVALVAVWKAPRFVLMRREEEDPVGLRPWLLAGVSSIVFALTLWPVAIASLALWRAGDYATQNYVWRNAPAGIDLATLLLGNRLHPFMGGWTAGVYARFGIDPIEGAAWPGVVPAALSIVAVRRLRSRAEVQALLWTGGLFLLWSLGPYLRVFNYNTAFVLPQILLRYVPVAANARIPGRAFTVVQLTLALLGAVALASIRPGSWRRPAIATLAIAGVLLDYWPAAWATTALHVPAIYSSLAQLPDGVVLEAPLGIRDGFGKRGDLDHRTFFYQTVHQHPQMGGMVARLSNQTREKYEADAIVGPLLALSEGAQPPVRATGDCRASLACAVRYLVLDRERASPDLDAFVEQAFVLTPIARSGSRELFAVSGLTGCGCQADPPR